MKPCDDRPFLHCTRSDICLEIRLYLIALLNQTLACTMDLRSHIKQARSDSEQHLPRPGSSAAIP
jgi:hypothetical protein